MSRHFLKAAALVVAASLICLAGARAWRERTQRSVEICVPWKDTADLIARDALRAERRAAVLASALERLRTVGVSTLALKEETLEDWARRGQAIYFSRSEIEKLKSLGLVPPDVVRADLLWVKTDPALLQRVARLWPGQAPAPRKVGGMSVLETPGHPWEEHSWLRVGMDPDWTAELRPYGFSFAYLGEETAQGGERPLSGSVFKRPGGKTGSIPENRISPVPEDGLFSAWLFLKSPDDPGPDKEPPRDWAETVATSRANFVLIENQPRAYERVRRAARLFSDRALRAHTVPPEELRNLSAQEATARWVRAVHERCARFLYYRWHPDLSFEQNLDLLRRVGQALKARGYRLERVPFQGGHPAYRAALHWRLAAAFLVAVAAPLWALYRLRRELEDLSPLAPARSWRYGTFALWLRALLPALAGGLAVAALLPDRAFTAGLESFRGVKPALLLPLLLSASIVIPAAERRQLLRRSIGFGELSAALAVLLAVFLYLERSGNSPQTAVSVWEIKARLWLEHGLGARPRFKEFLIGHPLLILGIHLRGREGGWRAGSAFALWGGSVALISIVNSFCHLHTPLTVTLLRSFHGLWLGALCGSCLVWAAERFAARPPRDPGPLARE